MRKTVLSVFLAATLIASVSACTGPAKGSEAGASDSTELTTVANQTDAETGTTESESGESEESTTESDETETESETDGSETESEESETESEGSETETEEETSEASEDDTDESENETDKTEEEVAEAVKASPLGEWLDSKRSSSVDSQMHSIQYRIVSVERDQKKVQEMIDEYNKTASSPVLELVDEALEYAVLDYEVKLPEDFPTDKEKGVGKVHLNLQILGADGEDIKIDGTSTVGLSRVVEIATQEEGLKPGDTYKGKAVFAAVKDFTDYIVVHSIFADGEQIETATKPE